MVLTILLFQAKHMRTRIKGRHVCHLYMFCMKIHSETDFLNFRGEIMNYRHAVQGILAIIFCCGCRSLAPSIKASPTSIEFPAPSIAALHESLLNGQITCTEIVHRSIARIKAYNLSTKDKAPLNAVSAINPNAYRIARDLDEYLQKHKTLKGPLNCVTVAVKDNIDTYDMPTSSGSLALLRSQPNADADVVNAMREAGAVILLKTTMDELAAGLHGQSSLNGRTGNVYDATQNAGGSSGGSAVAVAAGFAHVGLGTDNSGSVRIPAAWNGIYGLRPGKGRISSGGVFPRGSLDGEVGPMARLPEDLSILLRVLGNDARAPQAIPTSLKGLRIGIVQKIAKSFVYEHTGVNAKQRYARFFDLLKQQGAILQEISFPKFDNDRGHNMAGEIEDINDYLGRYPAARVSYRDLCLADRGYAFANVASCLKHIKETKPKNSREFSDVSARFSKNKQHVAKIMAEHDVQVLLSPISFDGDPTYDPSKVLTWQLPLSSNSGLPSLAFAFDLSDATPKLPVSMELLGGPGTEEMLIAITEHIAAVTKFPPFNFEASHQADSLLIDFDMSMHNNLFTTIGWRAYNHRKKNDATGLIDPQWFAAIVKETIATQQNESK